MRIATLDTAAAALFLAFGVWIVAQAFALGVTGDMGPGPGTFPLIAGILVTLFAAATLVRSRRSPEGSDDVIGVAEIARVAGILAAILAYLAVFGTLGAFLPLPFLMIAISLVIHARTDAAWLGTIAAISVAFTVACFLIFDVGLRVLLPEGPLGF
ncbi:tripartite tricarboxylate transporter TctB family protein [Marinivivus vitaminiproducens]|uniref:tripartite tricarboxylate transporter TctB family protein n=1 Tax=Marinivivus vitaminiproducens TaxID=3035935 RepID=UPI00279AA906|nr:tripartite tricarboxylate transporter TctB family protein [Geminicoccaceae bacterium SCSIO 64248]